MESTVELNHLAVRLDFEWREFENTHYFPQYDDFVELFCDNLNGER